MKRVIFYVILFSSGLFADMEWRGENTNFTLSQAPLIPSEEDQYLYNYNRLRLYGDWKQDAFFITAIGDAVNYLGREFVDSITLDFIRHLQSDTPFKTQSSFYDYAEGSIYARLYRLYGGYDDGENRVVVGLQNITIGVGHIWTPSNLFNPRNTYALEPDETFGVMALSATHHLSDQSQIYGAVSQKRDDSYKYLAGYKTALNTIDISINGIQSDRTKMLSYTIEGDLGETGIQLRSEGAYFNAQLYTLEKSLQDREFFQGIIGADYAFQKGLNLTVEAFYSSETFDYAEILANMDAALLGNLVMSHFYLGTTMSYDFTIYLSGALLYIESFGGGELDQNSRFFSPALTYTLNDNNTFVLGAVIQNGPHESEFGMFGNTYYFKYVLSF